MRISPSTLMLTLALPTNAITQQQTTLAFNQLQTWYNESIGLWIPSTGWWNSANCLTVVADLAEINSDVATVAASIYPNTYTEAQKYNLQLQKSVDATSFLMTSRSDAAAPKKQTDGFLNDYYDDEGGEQIAL
jgi:predicted ATPase